MKVWWKVTIHPREIPSSFCFISFSSFVVFYIRNSILLWQLCQGWKIDFGGSEQLCRDAGQGMAVGCQYVRSWFYSFCWRKTLFAGGDVDLSI